MFEVPRNLITTLARVGGGILLLLISVVPSVCAGTWHVVAPFAIGGLAIIVINARRFVLRPPLLRATRGGVWFGGGAIVPWREIAKVHDAGRCRENAYGAVWSRELGIAFRRRRAILAAPWPLWLTALASRRVVISLETVEEPCAVVVARLEAMRAAALDGEREGPRVAPPRARVVRR